MKFKLLALFLAFFHLIAIHANDPFISEIVAANDRTLKNEFGEYSDWIELHNPSRFPAKLIGGGLRDEQENPL